ncbi:MAG: tetratricopeptide repeat protein [Candidatus Heimdallarchaeota archaeon]
MPPSEALEKARTLREAGDFPEALGLLDKRLSALSSEERSERIACLNEQSQCYWRTGRLTDAELCAEKALRLADEFPPDLQGKAHALGNLGYISAEKEEMGRAEQFFERGLLEFEQIGTLQEIAGIVKALRIVNQSRGRQERSDEFHRRFLILQEQIERQAIHPPKEQMVSYDPAQIFLLGIKMTKMGPEVFLSQELPFGWKNDDLDEFELKVGIYYTTALGQGGAFHEGLYGPLPLTTNYVSLVYSRVLPDKTQADPRMPGRTYTVFCVGYPRGKESIFLERPVVSQIFEEKMSQLSDLSELTRDDLDNLRSSIFRTS